MGQFNKKSGMSAEEKKDLDKRVMNTVKAMRLLRRLPQKIIASELCMTQCNYSRLEEGEIAFSLSQLHKIAKTLDTSILQLLAIADADKQIGQRITPLSEIILRFVKMRAGCFDKNKFDAEELTLIISAMHDWFSTHTAPVPVEAEEV
jgi:transcriptional regulator with XRE-family HTH domain